jgi:hypothetical protein
MTPTPAPEDRAGTTRIFGAPPRGFRIGAVIAWAVIVPGIAALAFSPAGRQSGLSVWGATVLVAFFGVSIALLGTAMSRRGVIVSDGKVTIRALRSRTIEASEIRAVTLRSKGVAQPVWVPQVELANGKLIYLNALAGGSASEPPDPEQLATLDEFRALLGLRAGPQIEDAAPE